MNDQTPKPVTPPQNPPARPPAAKPPTEPVVVLASGVTEKGRMLYAMYKKRFGKTAGN